ncbi:MAG: hypothetical protein IT317_05515 [Anaerolineales bacterium]|nr:hypothetical protein [Anaerolineales bacterium]
MQPPRTSPLNVMLVTISLAAILGGLAIVAVTSPQSLDLRRLLPFLQPTAAPTRTAGPPPTSTVTLTPEPFTATPTVTPTAPPALVTSTATASEPPDTPGGPTRTPTPTEVRLPPDVRALAVITDKIGTLTARVRDVPDGAEVIAALPAEASVQVLYGSQVVNQVEWVPVRVGGGRSGWIARFLLVFVVERPPGPVTPVTPAPASATPVPPTQPPANTQPPPNTSVPGNSPVPSGTLAPSTLTPTRTATQPPPATATRTPSPTDKPTETTMPSETPTTTPSPTEEATATETATTEPTATETATTGP